MAMFKDKDLNPLPSWLPGLKFMLPRKLPIPMLETEGTGTTRSAAGLRDNPGAFRFSGADFQPEALIGLMNISGCGPLQLTFQAVVMGIGRQAALLQLPHDDSRRDPD